MPRKSALSRRYISVQAEHALFEARAAQRASPRATRSPYSEREESGSAERHSSMSRARYALRALTALTAKMPARSRRVVNAVLGHAIDAAARGAPRSAEGGALLVRPP